MTDDDKFLPNMLHACCNNRAVTRLENLQKADKTATKRSGHRIYPQFLLPGRRGEIFAESKRGSDGMKLGMCTLLFTVLRSLPSCCNNAVITVFATVNSKVGSLPYCTLTEANMAKTVM